MKKAIILTLAFVLFFSAGTFAAPYRCGVNPYDPIAGIEDCGVDKLDPNTDEVLAEYGSFAKFFSQGGFPSTLSLGDKVKFRLYVKNNLYVPVADNKVGCAVWQNIIIDTLTVRSDPSSSGKLNLGPKGMGQIDDTIWIKSDFIKATGAVPTRISCSPYTGSKTFGYGFVDPLTINTSATEVEVYDLVLPENNCTIKTKAAFCREIGDTTTIEYKIKNNSPLGTNITVSSPHNIITYGSPVLESYYTENCVLQGGPTLAPGQTATLMCEHPIQFCEGQSRQSSLTTVSPAATQANKTYYVVEDDTQKVCEAFHFTRLSPFSIYNNASGTLSIQYSISPETPISGKRLYFVAQIAKESEPYVGMVSQWDYVWETAIRDQELQGYDLQEALERGKKKLRIMAFDSPPLDPLPNPPTKQVGPTNSFSENLLDWRETNFAVPRMIQPNDDAYFASGDIFSLPASEFKLGLRNLSPVDQIIPPNYDGNPAILYKLLLKKGKPENITIKKIDCYEGQCQTVAPGTKWQDLPEEALEFSFSRVLDGDPPALNAKITMDILQLGDYEFRLEAQNNVDDTALDETKLNETLGAALDGASIESLTAAGASVGENAAITLKISKSEFLSAPPTVKIFDAETNELVATIIPPTKLAVYSLIYPTTRQGNFRAEAELRQPCEKCKESMIFSVNAMARTPVPETSLPAVALIALSVLAIMAFAGRKK